MGDPGVSRRGETQPGTGSALRSTCGTPVPRRPRWPRGTRKEGLQATTQRNSWPKHDANANSAHCHARGRPCSDGGQGFWLLFLFLRPGPATGHRRIPHRLCRALFYVQCCRFRPGSGSPLRWRRGMAAPATGGTAVSNSDDGRLEACMQDKRSEKAQVISKSRVCRAVRRPSRARVGRCAKSWPS